MERFVYPFSAVVDEEKLKKALLLNAVDTRIGGVLIKGPKGVAKSTTARALANLLPDIRVVKGCPFKCDPDSYESMRDRFGLSVEATQPDHTEDLIEISDRVEEFDRDPVAFIKKYSEKEDDLRRNIMEAKKILPYVSMGPDLKAFIADTVIKLQAGNRAMIVSVKASKAIAALQGRKAVNLSDVTEALEFTLGHRAKDTNMIRATIEKESKILETRSATSGNGEGEEDSSISDGGKNNEKEDSGIIKENVSMALDEKGTHSGRAGISDFFRESGTKDGKKIDFHSSFVNMALDGRKKLMYEDLKFVLPKSRASIPVILALDASRSMETQKRIEIARGLARSILLSAYRIRSRLAYITFSGSNCTLQQNFTRNLDAIDRKILATKAYGKTPLAAALKMMYELSNSVEEKTVSILITDGRANVPIRGNVEEEIIEWSRKLKNVTDLFLISSTFGSEKFMPSYNEEICSNSGGTLIDMPKDGSGVAIYSGFRHF